LTWSKSYHVRQIHIEHMSIPHLIMEIALLVLAVIIGVRTKSRGTTVAAVAVFVIGLASLLEELMILRIIYP
jgi:hypothetical protein